MTFASRAAFGLALALLFAFGEGRAAENEKLPTAKEILERYAKAIGGKEAFMKHNSQRSVGTVNMPAQNLKGKMEVFAARPNKLLIKMNLPGIGDMNTAYDGKNGWVHSPLTGAMILEGKMLDQVAGQADFNQSLHSPEDYTKMELVGSEEFAGEDCYKLRLVHKTGFETTEYFSKKDGLQKGFTATQESPLGSITATTLARNYKKFGDLYLPSEVVQKAAGVETVMTIEEMEFDKVDPKVFEAPDEVKAALQKPAAKPAPADKKQGDK